MNPVGFSSFRGYDIISGADRARSLWILRYMTIRDISIRRFCEDFNIGWLSERKRGHCQSYQKSSRKNSRRIQAHQCIQMQYNRDAYTEAKSGCHEGENMNEQY